MPSGVRLGQLLGSGDAREELRVRHRQIHQLGSRLDAAGAGDLGEVAGLRHERVELFLAHQIGPDVTLRLIE